MNRRYNFSPVPDARRYTTPCPVDEFPQVKDSNIGLIHGRFGQISANWGSAGLSGGFSGASRAPIYGDGKVLRFI
jgi:hypothetical protein